MGANNRSHGRFQIGIDRHAQPVSAAVSERHETPVTLALTAVPPEIGHCLSSTSRRSRGSARNSTPLQVTPFGRRCTSWPPGRRDARAIAGGTDISVCSAEHQTSACRQGLLTSAAALTQALTPTLGCGSSASSQPRRRRNQDDQPVRSRPSPDPVSSHAGCHSTDTPPIAATPQARDHAQAPTPSTRGRQPWCTSLATRRRRLSPHALGSFHARLSPALVSDASRSRLPPEGAHEGAGML